MSVQGDGGARHNFNFRFELFQLLLAEVLVVEELDRHRLSAALAFVNRTVLALSDF